METVRLPVDTDGILDRCSECEARARFVVHDDFTSRKWGIECTECANATSLYDDRGTAMAEWNKVQRQERQRQTRVSQLITNPI